MNKIIIGCLSLISVIFPSCAKDYVEPVDNPTEGPTMEGSKPQQGKVAVVYFSATGTTEKVAKEIANATKGQLIEIQPENAYTSADLNWHDDKSRTSIEMNDKNSRPAIKNGAVKLNDINIVFIGYPIWWNEAPRVINTFIDSNNLKGKKIYTFCTSGSSPIEGNINALRQTYPTLDIVQGKRLNNATKATIESWIKSLSL